MQTAVSPGEFRRYAAPGVLGMIGISCYILADTFFVAKGTGSLGLAALNIAIPAYNLMNGLGPVSYTHLDVYKRQHLLSAYHNPLPL